MCELWCPYRLMDAFMPIYCCVCPLYDPCMIYTIHTRTHICMVFINQSSPQQQASFSLTSHHTRNNKTQGASLLPSCFTCRHPLPQTEAGDHAPPHKCATPQKPLLSLASSNSSSSSSSSGHLGFSAHGPGPRIITLPSPCRQQQWPQCCAYTPSR
jgi:hypothetical protein